MKEKEGRRTAKIQPPVTESSMCGRVSYSSEVSSFEIETLKLSSFSPSLSDLRRGSQRDKNITVPAHGLKPGDPDQNRFSDLVRHTATIGRVLVALTFPVLRLLELSFLEDLRNDLFVFCGAELILQGSLAGAIKDTLGTVAMRNKDLPAADDLLERDGAVLAPVVYGLHVIDKDDEVVMLALVEHLGHGVVSARHCG